MEEVGKGKRYWLQYRTLMKKHFILTRRNWTWIALITPILLVFLLWCINLGIKRSLAESGKELKYPPVVPSQPLSDFTCQSTDDCIMIGYSPSSNPQVNELMKSIADKQKIKVKAFDNENQTTDYALKNKDNIFSAVVFDLNDTETIPVGTINYKIYYSGDAINDLDVQPIQRLIDGALISHLTGLADDFTITTSTKDYPLVYKDYGNQSDAAASLGPLIFFFPPVVLLFIFLYQIVQEKENKLRMGMNLMGLKSSMFWASWFTLAQVFNVLMTLVLMLSGVIFQFQYFLNANFFVNFFLFFLFGSAMISIAFFLSTLIHKAGSASNAGMAILIVGFIMQLVLGNQFFIYALFDKTAAKWVQAIKWVLILIFPPFNFSKCFSDISSRTSPVYNPDTDSYDNGPGYHWKDLYTEKSVNQFFTTVEIPSTSTVMWYMVLQMTIYTILTWYCDNVIGGPNGSAKSFYFFLTPRYWGFHTKNDEHQNAKIPLVQVNQDPDVANERQKAIEDNDQNIAVRMINLTKTYRNNPFVESNKDVHALKGVFLTVPNGECFCLLGHNGSGKTTMINTLNGLFYPTNGTAVIYGFDITQDIDQLRNMMGVCPQHDILWPELTAREHLQLFAEFKGVPTDQIEHFITKSLKEVGLYSVGDDQSKTFSGGMKRRLSVAISSIGDPKMIFMDEPTTGLDPMSKRHIWELIQDMKKNRVIFLTTHSLEEADVLSDKIAIMSYGEIKCLGTPLHLKNRFGSGYRINILTETQSVPQLKEIVAKQLPESELWAENAGNLTYKVPLTRIDNFSAFCELLERGDFPIVKDWGVSQTTLEDVFLRVTAEGKFAYSKVLNNQQHQQNQLTYQSNYQVPLDPTQP